MRPLDASAAGNEFSAPAAAAERAPARVLGRGMHPVLYRCFVAFVIVSSALRVLVRRLVRGPADARWSLPFEVAVDVSRRYMRHGFDEARAGLEVSDAPVPRFPTLWSRVALRREELAGLRVEVHTPRGWTPEDGTLLYFHGGGYISCSPRTHRDIVSRIAWHGRVRAIVPRYAKAPAYPYPIALDSAVECLRSLFDSGITPNRLVLGGDSAGGGLALAALVRLREAGLPMPRAAVLLSPWVDLTASGDSVRGAKLDILDAEMVTLGATLYAGDAPLTDPHVSPLYATLAGLPPLLVQTGEHEVFFTENHRFVERAREAGVRVEHEVIPAMTHVFQSLAIVSPEARAALRSVGRFLRRELAA